jgi:glycosyltransferase involved in cell wall biosynthesis
MTAQQRIRIGIDARELVGDTTGTGRYLGELLVRWAERPDAAMRELTLYTPQSLPILRGLPAEAGVREVVCGSGRGTWWEQTHLRRAVRSDPPDVFFAAAYTAPLALGVPLALAVHDVSFAAHPEWFRPREGARRRLITRQAARRARVVFTLSAFSKREIVDRLGIAPDRVRIINPGVTTRREGPAREPLVLFVGSIFNRRRLPAAIAAFRAATDDLPEARFVIAGANRTYPPQDLRGLIAESGLTGRVDLLDYVSEAELDTLYARAKAFIFLSEYEGFGLTPLEALSARVPIIVLDTPVAREVYGQAAIYVAPEDDVQQAATALRGLLIDPDAASDPLRHAATVVGRYSWEVAAAATLTAIEQAAG